MKLSTIWSLRDMSTLERLRRTREWAAMETATHLLPKRIRYWTTVTEIGRATRHSKGHVMGMTVDEVLKNLDRPKNVA